MVAAVPAPKLQLLDMLLCASQRPPAMLAVAAAAKVRLSARHGCQALITCTAPGMTRKASMPIHLAVLLYRWLVCILSLHTHAA